MIVIKYFGKLTDESQTDMEEIPFSHDYSEVILLKQYLETKFPKLSQHAYQISVNQTIVKSGAIQDGDEIALLPPFSGG